MRYTFLGIGFILFCLFGVAWVIQGNDFFMAKVFAPKYEQVRRETFEQSKSYNEGMAQELSQAQVDYARAHDSEEKKAIGALLLHRYGGYDVSKLPVDQREFLNMLKQKQIGGE